VRAGLARDQREEALGVGVAFHELAVGAEVPLELRQVLDHAVVGEQAARLLERVRVAHLERSRRGETDVRDERPRYHLLGLARELAVLVRGDRLLGDMRLALRAEPAQTGAVGLVVALLHEALGRIEQPERRIRAERACAHAKQPAHRRPGYPGQAHAVPSMCNT